MSPMDSLTLYWAIAWTVFIACPLYVGTVAVRYGRRWLDGRRKDREWAADIGAALSLLQTPGLPGDGEPLEPHEQDEFDRIGLLYGADADEPATRQNPRRTP